MDEALINKVRKDLLRSGVGSELLAIQGFRSTDWDVTGASYFLDRDHEKSREIDLFASKIVEYEFRDPGPVEGPYGGSWFTYSMLVAGEVKKSKSPWVVLQEPVVGSSLYEGWLNLIHSYNLPVSGHLLAKEIDATSLAKIEGKVGIGVHETFKKPNSESRWFQAAVGACKAAEHFLLYHISHKEPSPKSFAADDHVEFLFAKPLVLLDAPLFAAEIGSSGEIEIREIEWATLRFEFSSPNYKRGRYHPDCVALGSLDRYLQILDSRWEQLLVKIGEALPRFALEECSRVT